MHIAIAPDSFKECLTSRNVASAIRKGILDIYPDAKCSTYLVSDGGEGFLEVIEHYVPGILRISSQTVDPLGRLILADYLYDDSAKTAYVELAQASGLHLLNSSERNPLKTSTFGTGLQIGQAIEQGANIIYVGLGGSATNDAGMGIAQALGYLFLDKEGCVLNARGENLENVRTMHRPKEEIQAKIIVINDVQNPLFGSNGAAYVYAEQKGANRDDIILLDAGLKHFSNVNIMDLKGIVAHDKGSGSAGGTAYGLKTFFNAHYIPGTDFVFKLAGLYGLLNRGTFDLVITGEGKVDKQTYQGKLIQGIIRAAKPSQTPVAAVCGKLELTTEEIKILGLYKAVAIHQPNQSLDYSFRHAEKLIRENVKKLL